METFTTCRAEPNVVYRGSERLFSVASRTEADELVDLLNIGLTRRRCYERAQEKMRKTDRRCKKVRLADIDEWKRLYFEEGWSLVEIVAHTGRAFTTIRKYAPEIKGKMQPRMQPSARYERAKALVKLYDEGKAKGRAKVIIVRESGYSTINSLKNGVYDARKYIREYEANQDK